MQLVMLVLLMLHGRVLSCGAVLVLALIGVRCTLPVSLHVPLHVGFDVWCVWWLICVVGAPLLKIYLCAYCILCRLETAQPLAACAIPAEPEAHTPGC